MGFSKKKIIDNVNQETLEKNNAEHIKHLGKERRWTCKKNIDKNENGLNRLQYVGWI